MHNELNEIKSKIINSAILITGVFVTPLFVSSTLRAMDIGRQPVFFIYAILFLSFVVVFLYRNTLNLYFKVYFLSISYVLVSLLSSWHLGLYGGGYICVMGVATISILFSQKKAIVLNTVILLMFLLIAIGYLKGVLKPTVDLLAYNESVFAWINRVMGLTTIISVFIFSFGRFYQLLEATVKKNKDYREQLERQNEKLEETVRKRTFELQEAVEELQTLTEELTESNSIAQARNEELHTALESLKSTQKQLIQSEKMASIGILTAGIAHEINNPVNFISGGISGLKTLLKMPKEALGIITKKYGELELSDDENQKLDPDKIQKSIESIERMIANIETGVDRTNTIMRSMRAFSSTSDNIFEITDINKDIDNVLILLYNKYKGRINIEKHYCADSCIEAISGNMQQVFMNLFNNAVQAIEEKGTITISTFWSSDKEYLNIAVKDTGKGIPKDKQSKIFDPFFTTKDVGGGTGLGLYLSYQFVEQHRGNIHFISKENEGTEFVVQLPKNRTANG